MPMRTVAQLIADSNGTVADLVICLVQVDMFRLAARTTNCASVLAPEQVVLLNDTQPSVIRSKQTQNARSGSDMPDRQNPARLPTEKPRYYAAITSQLLADQSNVIDHVIQFAIDTLGARHIELRVYDAD
jgi:hypothetical protein